MGIVYELASLRMEPEATIAQAPRIADADRFGIDRCLGLGLLAPGDSLGGKDYIFARFSSTIVRKRSPSRATSNGFLNDSLKP